MALLQLRMICFLSLFYEHFPLFFSFCLPTQWLFALHGFPLIPAYSLSLSGRGCHGQIVNLCTHGRRLQLSMTPETENTHTCELHVYIYIRHVHALHIQRHEHILLRYLLKMPRFYCLEHKASYQKPPPSFFQSRLILCIWLNFSHL